MPNAKTSLLANYKTEDEAARELRQSGRTLRSWRRQGLGPAYIKIGRKIFYSATAIEAWLKAIETMPVRSRRAA